MHSRWSHTAASRRCMQITVSKQSGSNANQYLDCNCWKHSVVVRSWDSLEGYIKKIMECHKLPFRKSYAVFPGAKGLSRGYMDICWRLLHQKCPFPHHEAEDFSLYVRVELIKRIGLCPHSPRMLSSSWISFETSRPLSQTDSWSSLPQLHVGRQAPKLEPSALGSCDIRLWVHGQSLPLFGPFY